MQRSGVRSSSSPPQNFKGLEKVVFSRPFFYLNLSLSFYSGWGFCIKSMCLGNSSFLGSAHRLHVVLIDVWRVVNAKGGTEKVFCDMANALASQGFEVSAICFDENKGLPGYPLDSSVRFINAHNDSSDSFFDKKFVEKMRAWSFNKTQRKINRFILKTRKYQEGIQRVLERLKKVDIFISYQCETTFVLRELLNVTTPIVTMLHANPGYYWNNPLFPVIKKAVEKSNVVQVLLPEFVEEARQYVKDVPIIVIPNVAPQYKEFANVGKKKIINIARLDLQKDPELLVRAFALLKNQYPDWICEWWGEITVNPTLTKRIKKLITIKGLEGRFLLKGVTDDVSSKLQDASIFAFPSIFEGFGIALAEGLAMGLPAVGRKDCPAVSTLIRDGENGFLTDSTPQAFAEGLARLMESEELRYQLGTQGKEDMKAYSAERVWGAWGRLIHDLVRK